MLATAVLAAGLCAVPDRAIVSEILYDAAGDDQGREFVELYNPTAHRVDVSGLRLEVGDGAAPGRWTLRWTAPVGSAIEAGERFVVGGASVSPAPDAVVELALQNGPDAVRLVWPDGAVEIVGYGALTFTEYACGRPAVDVASGQSLARVPDASDLGENALDFRSAAPSPGRTNQPGRHVAWIPGTLALDPEQPAPETTVRVTGRLVNAGAQSLRPGEIVLRALVREDDADVERGRLALVTSLASGESLSVEVEARAPGAGVHVWLAALDLVGDEFPEGTRDSLSARTGPGPLTLTEIQFHPRRGEGEWVEVKNASHGLLDLGAFRLSDRSGTRGVPEDGASCPSESLAVLAQDRGALLAAYPGLDPARVVAVEPWPSLNNSDGSDGLADVVRVRDADDLPSDAAPYSAAGVPAGVPLERGADGRWRAASDPAGTPLAPPREARGIAGAFSLLRPRLGATERSTRLAWSLPWGEARIAVHAYDLAGGHAATLLAATDVAGRGESDVGVESLSPGLYVVVLQARSVAAGEQLDATQLLRIEGRRP